MICCFPFTVINSGVLKENFFKDSVLRAVFHRTVPLARSSAITKGWSEPSQLKTKALSVRMGAPPFP
jgi:hypothetical protein